jgi:hypothetical protein
MSCECAPSALHPLLSSHYSLANAEGSTKHLDSGIPASAARRPNAASA